MMHILISFFIHWIIFFSVAYAARWLLQIIGYHVSLSLQDLLVFTFTMVSISGFLHMIGFILFKAPMDLLFNTLYYVQ